MWVQFWVWEFILFLLQGRCRLFFCICFAASEILFLFCCDISSILFCLDKIQQRLFKVSRLKYFIYVICVTLLYPRHCLYSHERWKKWEMWCGELLFYFSLALNNVVYFWFIKIHLAEFTLRTKLTCNFMKTFFICFKFFSTLIIYFDLFSLIDKSLG